MKTLRLQLPRLLPLQKPSLATVPVAPEGRGLQNRKTFLGADRTISIETGPVKKAVRTLHICEGTLPQAATPKVVVDLALFALTQGKSHPMIAGIGNIVMIIQNVVDIPGSILLTIDMNEVKAGTMPLRPITTKGLLDLVALVLS